MRYASGDDYLHRHRAKQRYVGSPSELLDRNPDNGKAYWRQNQLTF
jgi:hypothetical protein